MKKIAFFYSPFFPIKGGASVHGYHLANELTHLGYEIHIFQPQSDSFTFNHSRNFWGIIRGIWICDFIYVRLPLSAKPNLHYVIPFIGKLLGKKVVGELNSPADEVIAFGNTKEYKTKVDNMLRRVVRKLDHLITVSDETKKYCVEKLEFNKVSVLPNGGEVFNKEGLHVSNEIRALIEDIKQQYQYIVLWSGSADAWQGYHLLTQIANQTTNSMAFIAVLKGESPLIQHKNVFVLQKVDRESLMYITLNANIGLAIYDECNWSEFGFYFSPLKFYEYMNNGLYVIASEKGQMANKNHTNVFTSNSIDEIVEHLNVFNGKGNAEQPMRTWRTVAEESAAIFDIELK